MNQQSNVGFERFQAFHTHWTGALLLSKVDNRITHEGTNAGGSYELQDRLLRVCWDKFGTESFIFVAGSFVQEAYLKGATEIGNIPFINIGGNFIKLNDLSVEVPDQEYEVTIRSRTTDTLTFRQIFLDKEYASSNLPQCAASIVDLGANVGYGTVWFGLRYPSARILCVEPDPQNFAALRKNTSKLGDRIHTRQLAVWTSDGEINLHTKAVGGRDLGSWGVQVSEASNEHSSSIPCRKLINILDDAGFEIVDILKVDIEGAELELFSTGAAEWLDRIKMVIIETHDRFRSGSEAAVRSALLQDFNELPRNGENLFFVRK